MDNIKYVAKLHWVIFIWPVVFCIICVVLGTQFVQTKEIGFFLLIFSLLWLATTWVKYYFSSLTIEKKQVIFRTGVLLKKITDIPFSKIESIDISQSIWGSVLNFGTLMIVGTGGTKYYIVDIARPLTCRRYIEEMMNAE